MISCGLKLPGFLLFVVEVCIAVIPHGKVFYLLDSHSRDKKGLPVPYGTSVLLKFANVLSLRGILLKFSCKRTVVFTKCSL